jgi:hypothetical protein
MADVKTAYGTGGVAITCTLASLAISSYRESTAVDNTTNLWLDALVSMGVKLQAGTPANDKAVYVYCAGSIDGTTWGDAVTGSDAAITPNAPINLKLLGAIWAPTSAGTFEAGPWSVASVFGGVMPKKWSIVVWNRTGIALDSTEGNHYKLYTGVYSTVL